MNYEETNSFKVFVFISSFASLALLAAKKVPAVHILYVNVPSSPPPHFIIVRSLLLLSLFYKFVLKEQFWLRNLAIQFLSSTWTFLGNGFKRSWLSVCVTVT